MLVGVGACSSDTLAYDAASLGHAEDRAQVDFDLLVPLSDLPMRQSRAITDDSAIGVNAQQVDNYTLLVFNHDAFVETVRPGDTYTDMDHNVQPKIVYDKTNGGRMKIALDKTMDAVRLMMVANHQLSTATVSKLTVGTSWTAAETALQAEPFSYNGQGTAEHMPMYGHSGTTPFQVKQGMVGIIQLQRCMARVVVDCFDALDHFTLENIYLYNINQTGYLAPQPSITTLPVREPGTNPDRPGDNPARYIHGSVDPVKNIGTVYVPELNNLFLKDKDYAKNTSVIIKGTYTYPKADPTDKTKTEVRYYRLEFIRRDLSSGSIQYVHVNQLERNKSYVFQIDYLVDKIGTDKNEKILDKPAANVINEGTLQVFTFTDVGIKDVTTDNLTYLGVTDSKLMAQPTADDQYYCVNVRVISNHPEGFAVQSLPTGCTTNYVADPADWNKVTKPAKGETPKVHSIWFFFNRDVYDAPPGAQVDGTKSETLYFYAGNIRKSVTVYSPYAIGF